MAGKQNKQVAFTGYAVLSPPSSSNHQAVVLSGGSYVRTNACESQNTTKAVYKHPGGGATAKFSQTEKAGSFIDRRSGNHGYKQEVNYKSSVKVNDKARGCTTEYETQVKVKETTTYHTPKNSTAYKSVKYYHG